MNGRRAPRDEASLRPGHRRGLRRRAEGRSTTMALRRRPAGHATRIDARCCRGSTMLGDVAGNQRAERVGNDGESGRPARAASPLWDAGPPGMLGPGVLIGARVRRGIASRRGPIARGALSRTDISRRARRAPFSGEKTARGAAHLADEGRYGMVGDRSTRGSTPLPA